jgi:cytoskeletal protein RodZ
MKTCSTCHRTYSDDTLSFCLDDGSALSKASDSEATQILPGTRVPPRPTIASTPPQSPRPTFSSTAVSGDAPKTNPLLWVIVVLLALIAGGGLVALIMLGRSSNPTNQVANVANNEQSNSLQQKQVLQNQQAELERQRQQLEDERKKLETEKTKPAETATPAVDAPARINFRRGSVQETISGVVASSKSYVLKARAGQNLFATVTSNGCVVLKTGATSMSSVTVNGDNWITVINNCSSQTAFNLTVDIR